MAIILPGYIKLNSLTQKFSSMWQPSIVFVLNISLEKFGLVIFFKYWAEILGCKIRGISTSVIQAVFQELMNTAVLKHFHHLKTFD